MIHQCEDCGDLIVLSPSEVYLYNHSSGNDLRIESEIQHGVNLVLDKLGKEYIDNYENLFYGGES